MRASSFEMHRPRALKRNIPNAEWRRNGSRGWWLHGILGVRVLKDRTEDCQERQNANHVRSFVDAADALSPARLTPVFRWLLTVGIASCHPNPCRRKPLPACCGRSLGGVIPKAVRPESDWIDGVVGSSVKTLTDW